MSTSNLESLRFPIARAAKSNEPPKELIQLQDTCPLAKLQLFDGTPTWIATKHKDICQLLSTKGLSNERYSQPGYPELYPSGKKATAETPTFVHLDDPKHAEQRAMIEELFTRERIAALRPEIQRIVDHVLDAIVEKGCAQGPVDLVEDFATPIPTRIIYGILGVPEKDIPELSKASAIRLSTSGSATDAGDKHLHDYMSALVDKRIQAPGDPKDDLISKLVVEQYRPGHVTRDDIQRLAYLVLVAGNAAVISSISLGVLTLLQNPEQLNVLKEDSSTATAVAVTEEVLRYHTPSSLNSRRVAKQDTIVGGKIIKAGEGIVGAVQAGNRDPDMFTNPHNFDIRRDIDPDKNLAFGYGPHRCQAQWLSRVELEVAFATLFKRLPKLRLAVQPEDLEYTSATQNVGVSHLPVYF
ncbi:cytochrome P450 [Macroventuria anomochaeta]|uniref:Cytochrome P450 n=1 Tax=Macroventuria anomochaeta TaxID=301207 RepID=A0ACB6S152_9PLEO|nr:cytochrome P450 [Macroventuria anomochaeta]KAF2627237.1 cytochrome P450 [Macroventuria anomochaeta]